MRTIFFFVTPFFDSVCDFNLFVSRQAKYPTKCWPSAIRVTRSRARTAPLAGPAESGTLSASALRDITASCASRPLTPATATHVATAPLAKCSRRDDSGRCCDDANQLDTPCITAVRFSLSFILYISSCHCAAGYEGDRCETNIDDCVDHKCVNNATCVDQVESYRCDCLGGYIGKQTTLPRPSLL